MSASLKDNNGAGSDGERVDYDDPSLNGGRSRGPNVVHQRAHYMVNYGLIIMIAAVVFMLALCMTGCGLADNAQQKANDVKASASAAADNVKGAKKLISEYDLPRNQLDKYETMSGNYAQITARAGNAKYKQACLKNVTEYNTYYGQLNAVLSANDMKVITDAGGVPNHKLENSICDKHMN